MKPEDLARWYVRNKQGEMVPLSAFATAHWAYGSPRLERFNGQPSVELQGQAAPGLSSGDAMAAVEETHRQAAARHRLRMERHLLRGTPQRFAGAGAVCAVAAGGVPLPGSAV